MERQCFIVKFATMVKTTRIILLILFYGLSCPLNAKKVTLGSLLEEMTERESLAKYQAGINQAQSRFGSKEKIRKPAITSLDWIT